MNKENKNFSIILTILTFPVRIIWSVFKFLAKTIIVLIILITLLIVVLTQINTKYKFAFPEDAHIAIDKLNNYSDKNLSLATIYKNPKTKQRIDIEFLVPTSDYDIDLLPSVTDKTFLFSAIEFYNPTKAKISVSHSYNGEELPVIAEYIYHYVRTNDGGIDYNKKFIVSKAQGPYFDETERFVYVRIYKAPTFNAYYPKFLWFNNTMTQSLNIELEDEGKIQILDYTFDLKWIKTWDAFTALINVT